MLSHSGHSSETSLGALASCFLIFQTEFYKSKKNKCSDKNSLYTDVVLFGERGPRERKNRPFYFSFRCFRNRFLSGALDGH